MNDSPQVVEDTGDSPVDQVLSGSYKALLSGGALALIFIAAAVGLKEPVLGFAGAAFFGIGVFGWTLGQAAAAIAATKDNAPSESDRADP